MDSSVPTDSKRWVTEIHAARRREKDWRKDGRATLRIYGGDCKDEIPFNILYSNTETLLPAVYNSTPRPVVQRRFKDEDPLGAMASKAAQRCAEFLLDTNSEEYPSFDSIMYDAVLDALLPGRGVTLVKYDTDIVPGDSEAGTIPVVKWELVCFESVPWDRVAFGYAKKWCKVPWMAIYYEVDLEEATKLFGASIASQMTFAPRGRNEDADDKEETKEKTDEEKKVCPIWKVWDKASKREYFVAENYDGGFLKVEEDTLKLEGFFPVPEPLRFTRKANDQLPVALYKLYENQAKELNRITVRLNKIIGMMKVRGIYDSTISEIESVLKQEDGIMVPAQNVAALQDKGLDKALWLVPIEKLIPIVNEMIAARQQCKQVIYEITGISDILRGQTVASETLGAQKIKENWATLRLKRIQREVQRYARDLIRLAIEVAAAKFDEKTWAAITGLPFVPTQQKQLAMAQVQAASQSTIPIPIPPEVQQQAMAPSWGEVLSALQQDTQRNYRIDIETNSTVDLEATEDQKNISEVLNALSQFLHGIGPLVENGTMPFEAAKSMMLGIVRRYRFGPEIEDQIKSMQPPQPKVDPKAQMEAQQAQQEAAQAQEQAKLDMMIKKEEHALKMAELAGKKQFAEIMSKIKIFEAQAKLNILQQQGEIKLKQQREANLEKERASS